MTPREAYNSLVGTTIQFSDGDSAKIVNRLPDKDMYNELFKRRPQKYKNVKDIKKNNKDVNENIEELLTNANVKDANVPDYMNRHKKQGITHFDTRTVNFYDGENAYVIDFSIAKLNNGDKIAYAKKYIKGDTQLTQKIKTVEARSKKSSLNQQSLYTNSIPTSNNNVNTNNTSMQESENNSGSFNLAQGQEINKIKQDGSITMTYVRNANTNTQNYGSKYGQNIEPAGEYMSIDTMQGKYKIPGFK